MVVEIHRITIILVIFPGIPINEIKSVIVEDGITGLGKSSFYKSTSIQSVKLADSVRSIGEMCFFRNGSLEKIELGTA